LRRGGDIDLTTVRSTLLTAGALRAGGRDSKTVDKT
jgi:hypothetical protein